MRGTRQKKNVSLHHACHQPSHTPSLVAGSVHLSPHLELHGGSVERGGAGQDGSPRTQQLGQCRPAVPEEQAVPRQQAGAEVWLAQQDRDLGGVSQGMSMCLKTSWLTNCCMSLRMYESLKGVGGGRGHLLTAQVATAELVGSGLQELHASLHGVGLQHLQSAAC